MNKNILFSLFFGLIISNCAFAQFSVSGSNLYYSSGNVGLGTAKGGNTFCIKDDQKHLSIDNIEIYIKKNGHLPNVPSAKEVGKNRQDFGDIEKISLGKIEKLGLQLTQLSKE